MVEVSQFAHTLLHVGLQRLVEGLDVLPHFRLDEHLGLAHVLGLEGVQTADDLFEAVDLTDDLVDEVIVQIVHVVVLDVCTLVSAGQGGDC